jgi:hypothetical protein
MTHEGQDGGPDETQPPVTTQWSRPADRPTEETGELMPPFVPGRAHDPWRAEPALETTEAVVDTTELDAAGTEPIDSAVETDPVVTPEAEWEMEAPEVDLEALDQADDSLVQDAEVGSEGCQVVAERLESLAARIRAEGYGAAERDMASSDRLTSLIAGVVAGYLAGLRE